MIENAEAEGVEESGEQEDRMEAKKTGKYAQSPERMPAQSPERKQAQSPERMPAQSPERKQAQSPERKQAQSSERMPAKSPERKQAQSLERMPAQRLERNQASKLEKPVHSNNSDNLLETENVHSENAEFQGSDLKESS